MPFRILLLESVDRVEPRLPQLLAVKGIDCSPFENVSEVFLELSLGLIAYRRPRPKELN